MSPNLFTLSDWIQICALVGATAVAYYQLSELKKEFHSFKVDYVTKEVHNLEIQLLELKIQNIKPQENK